MPAIPEPEQRSPCVRNCTLDDADVCLGCGRTLQDILAWHRFDPPARAAAQERAAARLRERRAHGG